MSVAVRVNVGEFPAGIPARVGDPVGVWGGQANVVGDASGGTLALGFMATDGNERRYVYVVDHLSMVTDTAVDPGNARVGVIGHNELANVTLDNVRFAIVDSLDNGLTFVAQFNEISEWLKQWPIWWRRDFGQSDANQELISTVMENNNNGQTYQFRVGGRLYDARIVYSRDFRLLFPSGVAA